MAPDLDGRPGEPARSTLRRWILNCVSCGATAGDLSTLTPAARTAIDRPSYRNELNPFLRWALLAPEDPEPLLQAAWYEDDRGNAAAARAARGRAADLWGMPAESGAALRVLDVLRRAGRFGEAARLGDKLSSRALDDGTRQIVAFQRTAIDRDDDGRHLMSSALTPPAHTPHVAHRAAPKVAFWSRLLGR